MSLMMIIGTSVALLSIFFGVPEIRETLSTYLDGYSFLFVIGGTIGCTMIGTSFKDFLSTLSILSGWMYFKRKSVSNLKAVTILVEISEQAHRSGKASVLEMGKGVGDGFLDRALGLMSSGLEVDFVRNSLESDIIAERKRHLKQMAIIRSMGSYAPMFGMMGTVIGVILVLQNVTDIDSVVKGMSLALLTTFYGLVFASLFFIPITNKLKLLSEEDVLTKEIIMEGILAIMQNQIPLKVEKKLMSYLSSKVKTKMTKDK